MKNKLILWISVLLLLALIAFMAQDLFVGQQKTQENVYEYDLDALRQIDSKLISHKEILQVNVEAEAVHAIATDQEDNIYVATNKNIFIFDTSGTQKEKMRLRQPASCLSVSEEGNILVGMKNRVDIRKPDGTLRNSFLVKGERTYITSIVIDNNNIFIADAGQGIVHHYDIEGNKIKDIGEEDKEAGIKGFVIPSPYFDLLLGRQGELWVVNPGRHSLEAYNYNGVQISSWYRTSMSVEGFSGCCNPSNIAMLSDGSFVTAEKGIERIKIHHPSGDFKSVVAAPEKFTPGTVGIDLAVNSKDQILVLDPGKKMVRIFEVK